MRRDLGQAVGPGPAHDARIGVDAGIVPEFPQSRIGLVDEFPAPFPDRLQVLEKILVALLVEAAIEEGLGDGQDNAAVNVVLNVLEGLVAAAHRPHGAIAGKAVHGLLGEPFVIGNAVDGLQVAVLGVGYQVGDVMKVPLHGLCRAQAVERRYDEVPVAQPTEPVVPVASGIRGFRNG